jgi:hypothetical protein
VLRRAEEALRRGEGAPILQRVLTGFLGGSAVAVVACVALIVWLLVRAIPSSAIMVPGAIAAWCAPIVWLLG